MDARAIAEALDGKWEGRQYRCLCPVHGGHALMVRDSDSTPLLHCWGGCEFREIVRELRDRGLWPESSAEAKQQARERKRAEDVEQARRIVVMAHESEAEIPDRFGREYRWARKVLKFNGYKVTRPHPSERRFEGERVRVEAKR